MAWKTRQIISTNTMNVSFILDFLEELSDNNSKEWMDANKSRYLQAREAFITLVNELLDDIKQFDPDIAPLAAKDCIFRINRDIRFSKNKDPYKNNFGASISEGGKKSASAGYYLHIQPGNESFIGGGLYMPPGEHLKKVRQEIDYNAPELLKVVSDQGFKKSFGVVQGEKLARAPKGYDPAHPNIEFLKLKSYVVLHKLSDEDLKSPRLRQNLAEHCHVMKPFLDFLNVAVS